MRYRLLLFLAWGACVLPANAQPPAVPSVKLTVRPAAAPDPALKYQLLPELLDQSPGNAALLYQRSHSPEWLFYRREKDYYKEFEALGKMPLQKLPGSAAVTIANSAMLRELDLAARREQCDWEMTTRFKKEAFSMLLPDMQWFREAATLLSIRARLEMAEGKYDKAVHTFQTSFALSRHLSETPIIITGLIGLALGQVTASGVEEFIQQPDAPNLYWALANLPRPFLDLRRCLQGEKAMIESMFQEILGERPGRESIAGQLGMVGITQRHVAGEPRRMTAEELQVMVDDLYALAALSREGSSNGLGRVPTLVTAIKNYPQSRENLIARGRKAQEVDALPVLQVVALDSLHQFRWHRDEMYKWIGLPYWEAQPGLEAATKRFEQARAEMEAFPALLDLLPASSRVLQSTIRLDRRLAALRCVEALRLHAAANDGKLPATLGAVKEVPMPIDPLTGKEFGYQAVGNKATLHGPPPAGELPAAHNTIHYEITLAK